MLTAADIAQAIVSGLLLGTVYGLIGIGLAIIFGVMDVVNFAHGEMVMVGMYVAVVAFTQLGVDPFLSVVLSAPLLFLLGVFVQHLLVRPTVGTRRADSAQTLVTVGLGLMLANLALLIFSANFYTIQTPYAREVLRVAGISLSWTLLGSFVVTALLTGAFYLFFLRTDVGKSMRATALNREAALLMGINVDRMSALAFGMGAALAGAAGSLLAPIYYVFPYVGGLFTLRAFAVVILGGMRSVSGAIFGGLVLGVGEALGTIFVGTGWKDAIAFGLLILVLMLRPRGLFGRAAT